MRHSIRAAAAAMIVAVLGSSSFSADNLTEGLKKGSPTLKSVGPLAFGPQGILFVSDPAGASILAVATGDTTGTSKDAIKVEKLDDKVASLLGSEASKILINDVKVNPASGNIYLSVSRGRGPDAAPVIVKLARDGKLSEFTLKDVAFAQVELPAANTTASKKNNEISSITGMSYINGKLIVAGTSNEQFASRLRVIPFPFKTADKGAAIEIYHGAHGKLETEAPVRTFAPYKIGDQERILAAYQCTPLVMLPVDALKPGEKVKGTTVAELGNGNRPLDMIVYKKDGKDYLLLSNSARGVMKIPTEGIDKVESISSRIAGTAGQKYETIDSLKGVVQLDKLDDTRAIVVVSKDKALHLETVPLP